MPATIHFVGQVLKPDPLEAARFEVLARDVTSDLDSADLGFAASARSGAPGRAYLPATGTRAATATRPPTDKES